MVNTNIRLEIKHIKFRHSENGDNFLKNLEKKFDIKVDYILKGSLDLIPSPSSSVKIQIKGGKFA